MKSFILKIQSVFLFLSVISTFGNNGVLENRSLYVDNFSNILGSYNKQKELFDFAKEHKITNLILYDLNKINERFFLGDGNRNKILVDFIKEARKEGIEKISASGESGEFFKKIIHPYNLSRKNKEERFDIYNLEYEYWNESESKPGGYYCDTYLKNGNLACDRDGSFEFYMQSLETMCLLAEELDDEVDLDDEILVEAYIGNFNKKEIEELSFVVDRLLIHNYVAKEERLFPYVKQRLKFIEDIHSDITVSILYSTECRYLGTYLVSNPYHVAEQKFFEGLNLFKDDLDEHINFTGFTYYNYSHYRYVENIKQY